MTRAQALAVADLFDMRVRAQRRDRAARRGFELFLHNRTFDDCLERIGCVERSFEHALLIGCPSVEWPRRLRAFADEVKVLDPAPLLAKPVEGQEAIEDQWQPQGAEFDLILAIGTLDTVNHLPLALRLIRYAMRGNGLFIGAMSGGDTVPQLRAAMRAADSLGRAAAPHVHPRIEAAALAPLISDAGFVRPVVDVDRAQVSYPSLQRLVEDLRQMAATNVLSARPRFISKAQREAAIHAFAGLGNGERTTETFELLHFAAWTPLEGLQGR